jgi:hypothetical protein
MTTLKLDEKTARKLYPKATTEFKEMLEETFGKNIFSQNVIDRVKTFEDVLTEVGETQEQFDKRTEHDSDDDVAYKQAKLIALALNEGKILDGTNTNVYKYFPWHKVSGAGLVSHGYVSWNTNAHVGSRLCLDTSEKAIYAGNQFIDIYTRLKIK